MLLFASTAIAELSLDEAKHKGLVGEDANGYLATVVPSPDSDVRALIRSINDKRREEYERIAASNNIEVTAVEQLAGKKAIEKTKSGYYIRLPGTDWQRK
jgi:hypothetical protein